ncbi:zona pellucida sperm-binding protein 3-like [Austrofundulus limnaeus]|uniref:Zona pellucida sperm-binding protein 3 n=1 Tax=Austrofundulus limnaeus TaxID=52670 RepID=A0A2I4BIX1_AUSLI|nr:PREDICTED: zona pellucida sperm-binding protein 3-like [Austrofundulus limnaeus]
MMKLAAVCIVVLALIGSLCEAQLSKRPPYSPPQAPQAPQVPSLPPVQSPQQQQQAFEPPLTWKYPAEPPPETQPVVPFELRYPVPAATVAVMCREDIAHVEVKKDFFGIGQLISPADITLGLCAPTGEDINSQVYIFEAELQECGSVLAMTDIALIYTFVLNYNPKPLGSAPVVRTNPAAVIVECHYPRNFNVSSGPINPTWVPYSQVKMAEEFLYFTLKLMTDDWLYERPSHQYFLGDLIRIEATVKQYFHVPLRVYIDRCVATLTPDVTSVPNYAFIDNHGCFIDARVTGSKSQFMHRTVENKLEFQLEAFRFDGAATGEIYITCNLVATSTSHAIDNEHRACSYLNYAWTEASGSDGACASCETGNFVAFTIPSVVPSAPVGTGTHPAAPILPPYSYPKGSVRKLRSLHETEIPEWEGQVTLGPIPVEVKKQ